MNFIEKDEIYLKKHINLTEYFDSDQIRYMIKNNLIPVQESQVYKSYKEKYKNFKDNFYKYLLKHTELWDKDIHKLKGSCFSVIFITTKLDKYLSESINDNWVYHKNWHPSWWGLPTDTRLDKIVKTNHQGAILRYLVKDKGLDPECLPICMSEKEEQTFKSYVDDFGVDLASVPGFISHNLMNWN